MSVVFQLLMLCGWFLCSLRVGLVGLVVEIGLITESLQVQLSRSIASNLEQVAYLLCAQPTQPPALRGMENE